MLRKMLRLAFAAALFTSALALAQTLPPGPPAPGQAQAQPPGADRPPFDCTERYARLAARLAYLQVKLELTADQRALWDKWRDAVTSGADQRRAQCKQSSFQPGAHPTIVERQAQFGRITALRAQSLQTAQPALEALYQALTPEQREVLDRPMMGGDRHRHDHDWRRGPQRQDD